MQHKSTLTVLILSLLVTGCEPYPDNAKDVALGMCLATKNLDISKMKKYTTETYGKHLAQQMKSFKIALKADDPKAIELKQTYSQISCDDLTLIPGLGRMMLVKSSSDIIAKMKLEQVKNQWKVIE